MALRMYGSARRLVWDGAYSTVTWASRGVLPGCTRAPSLGPLAVYASDVTISIAGSIEALLGQGPKMLRLLHGVLERLELPAAANQMKI
eukprot:6726186-Pyramimonas_sp.AAC.1